MSAAYGIDVVSIVQIERTARGGFQQSRIGYTSCAGGSGCDGERGRLVGVDNTRSAIDDDRLIAADVSSAGNIDVIGEHLSACAGSSFDNVVTVVRHGQRAGSAERHIAAQQEIGAIVAEVMLILPLLVMVPTNVFWVLLVST